MRGSTKITLSASADGGIAWTPFETHFCATLRKTSERIAPFRLPDLQEDLHRSHQRTLGTMYIPEDQAVLALQLLLEGNSIRSTERITKLDRNTIMRLLVLAGKRCESLMDSKMRGVHCRYLQIDEIWTYCGKKTATGSQGRFAGTR